MPKVGINGDGAQTETRSEIRHKLKSEETPVNLFNFFFIFIHLGGSGP